MINSMISVFTVVDDKFEDVRSKDDNVKLECSVVVGGFGFDLIDWILSRTFRASLQRYKDHNG